jgi:hypothetical protein
MTISRRGFFAGLAGVATAATFATRFPLFPREPVITIPKTSDGWGAMVARESLKDFKPAPKIEVGLLRVGAHELRARGYCRVAPESIVIEDGTAKIKACFPTVTHGIWTARGAGVYEKDGGPLLWYQMFDQGPMRLMRGTTLQTVLELQLGMGGGAIFTAAAQERLERTWRELAGLEA